MALNLSLNSLPILVKQGGIDLFLGSGKSIPDHVSANCGVVMSQTCINLAWSGCLPLNNSAGEPNSMSQGRLLLLWCSVRTNLDSLGLLNWQQIPAALRIVLIRVEKGTGPSSDIPCHEIRDSHKSCYSTRYNSALATLGRQTPSQFFPPV